MTNGVRSQLDSVRFGLVLLHAGAIGSIAIGASLGGVLTLALVVGDLFVRRSPRA
jgi:hypothetical protein